ncbi:MAG: flavodoxin [Bacteroidales bacterium]|nr:flavodoxin [Bacteroidales bacterium]
MSRVGVFYGSTSGSCETISRLIQHEFNGIHVQRHDIFKTSAEQIEQYDYLIFGISTWGNGAMQEDWQNFLNEINFLNLTKKKIALFGLGDQIMYSENFVDAMGILYHMLHNKGCEFVGFWPAEGYTFKNSRALQNTHFVGLAIDEDTQPQLTSSRIKNWVKQLKTELNLV